MQAKNQLYAAAAQVDITPPLGTIIGVDMTLQYARHIHDLLYAKALVLKNGNEVLAIVIVDICIMFTDYMDAIKADIQAKTGIKPQNILLASNHNHASGDVVGLLGGAADAAYSRQLSPLIVAAVVKAFKQLKPAKMGYGSTQAPEFVVCRRYFMTADYKAKNPVTFKNDLIKTNPRGGENKIVKRAAEPDPEVYFLAVKDLKDNWISVMGNYGLHYAADWLPDTITADYFGQFSKHIQAELGAKSDFVGMMSNGTSGDVNIWDFMQPDRLPKAEFAKSELIGSTLAKRVAAQILSIKWHENPDLKVEYAEISIKLRKPNARELKRATKDFTQKDFNDLGKKKDFIQRIYNREQVLLSHYPDTTTLVLQALKIGDLVIGALPGEFFAETGLRLKKDNAKRPYFSINLANAYGGYIPPEHEMEKGGYETWRARSSCMEVKAEEKIITQLNKMILNF